MTIDLFDGCALLQADRSCGVQSRRPSSAVLQLAKPEEVSLKRFQELPSGMGITSSRNPGHKLPQ